MNPADQEASGSGLPEFTEMKVFRMALDPSNNSPILLLRDETSGALLPIWIGIFEAHAIAMRMEDITPPRPMTHDLMRNILDVTHTMMERVELVDLVDNTFFARIVFMLNDQEHALDCRPSDAIALALRAGAPILVARRVLEQSQIEPGQFRLVGENEEGEGENLLRDLPKDTKLN